MNVKKLALVLILSLFLIQLSGFAAAQAAFNQVAVHYQGSWQWWADDYEQLTLKPDTGGMSLREEFDFDVDNPNERTITVSYLGQHYTIDAPKSQLGDQWVNFIVKKNGQQCGQKAEFLPLLSNAVIDLSGECGIKIWANWETRVTPFETDMTIEKILITAEEINRAQNEYFKNGNKDRIRALANMIKTANIKLRVLEKDNPNDFIDGELFFVHAKTEYFDEEDTSGKTKSLIITENLDVKYVIVIPEQWSTEFLVYKPAQEMKFSSIVSFSQLTEKLHSSEMQQIPIREIDVDALETIIRTSAEIAGPAAVTTAALYASGATLAMYYTGGLALGGTAAAGTVAATGGTILIIAPVAGVTYTIIEGSNTHTMITEDGELIFNWDREYWTWSTEGKINFILLKKDLGTTASVLPTPTGDKTGAIFIEFKEFPEGRGKENVLVSVENVDITTKWFGNKLIVYGLTPNQKYDEIKVILAGKIVTYPNITAREFDKGLLDDLP